jgi:hypothetical protein
MCCVLACLLIYLSVSREEQNRIAWGLKGREGKGRETSCSWVGEPPVELSHLGGRRVSMDVKFSIC